VRGSPYPCSQITEGVENAIPLHIGIPHIGRRDSDLPSEAGLREYLQYPFEYFLLVLPFRGYSVGSSWILLKPAIQSFFFC
jgi:hypothetical protein